MYKRVSYYGGSFKAARSSSSSKLARASLKDRWLKVPHIAAGVFIWAVLILLYRLESHVHTAQQTGNTAMRQTSGGRECIGWKETLVCHPFAERFAPGDKGCDEQIIPQISGYCLCSGDLTAARVTCGLKSFTCRQKCMELGSNPEDALEFPTPISCPYEVPYNVSNFLPGMIPPPASWSIDSATKRIQVEPVWDAVWHAVHKHDMLDVHAPSVRNSTHDFVKEDQWLDRSIVERVRSQVDAFKADIPAYPTSTYVGRGIVMVGGGLRYLISAWASVHQLRRSGCKLPVEMWFPLAEAPNQDVIAAFHKLGVTSRMLDFKGLSVFDPYEHKKAAVQPVQSQVGPGQDAAGQQMQQELQQQQQQEQYVAGGDLEHSSLHQWQEQQQRQQQRHLHEQVKVAQQRQDWQQQQSHRSLSADSHVSTQVGDGSSLHGAALASSSTDPSRPGSESLDATAADPEHIARFTIKVAALLLSSFKETLYLDADNIPVADPSYLFETAAYNTTGAVFWPDYWDNSVAPQVADMLGVRRSLWPKGSFESGQMLLDKSRHWRGLALAFYFNSYARFWYEMFTSFLGKGDKETFGYALLAAGEPMHIIATPPGSLGTIGTSMNCSPRTLTCRDEFTGNTMTQHDPDGRLLFLHANLHKWDMRLPELFDRHYQRRWQWMMPEDIDFPSHIHTLVGFDFERSNYDLIRHLKCQPWWNNYYNTQVIKGDRATPELDGFHFLLRGIEMDKLYLHGWSGNYMSWLPPMTISEKWTHWYWRSIRPTLVAWGWAKRRW